MMNIPYGKQEITDDDILAVVSALKSDYLTQGPRIAEFENSFSNYIGSKYAVAVSNGTAALHLSTMALGVNSKSSVITTPMTFSASANCVRYCNGEVIFADIDPKTGLIDLDKVKAILENGNHNIEGLILVDYAGIPIDLEKARKLADSHNIWIIEDACHAPGGGFTDSNGSFQNCGNGQYSDLAIFSFHPVKHIACGEGGMITTNNEKLYKKLLNLRTHGIIKELNDDRGGWYYEMQELGFNYRLTDFQAALGISQLSRLDENIERRKLIAKKYDEAFSKMGIDFLKAPSNFKHAYHLYIIKVPERRALYDYLRSKGIFTQVHYIPVHLMPYYEKIGFQMGDFPLAEEFYENCLSLPMFPSLKDEEQDYVIEKIAEFNR